MDHQRFGPMTPANRLQRRIVNLSAPKANTQPKVLINTTPKAGTYLAALALEKVGYTPVRLHLADRFYHDNRDVPDHEIHHDPRTRQIDCRADHIAAAMVPGEFCVGHIGDINILRKISEYNVHVINIVRDPVTQLESLYRFELAKTKPSPYTELWRSMPEVARFKGFLMSFNVTSLMKHSRALINFGPFFCFEDMQNGQMIERSDGPRTAPFAPVKLSEQRRRVIADIQTGLAGAIGEKTSTYIPENQAKRENVHVDGAASGFLEAAGFYRFSKHYRDSVLND